MSKRDRTWTLYDERDGLATWQADGDASVFATAGINRLAGQVWMPARGADGGRYVSGISSAGVNYVTDNGARSLGRSFP